MNVDHIVSVVTDPRKDKNQRYTLFELILVVLSSAISGFFKPSDMAFFAKEKIDWLREFSPFDFGTPSHETLRFFLCAINPTHLVRSFVECISGSGLNFDGDVISIDGKTVRGSGYHNSKDAIHVISAWSNEHGITLGALESQGKKNEIKTIPEVIDMLNVKGATITADAMGCQKDIAKKIIESGNDYSLQIKGNHKCLLDEIKAYHHILLRTNFENIRYSEFETIDKGHGRIEVRKYTHFELSDWVKGKDQWSELKTAIHVERIRHIKGEIQTEEAWYISSLSPNAKMAAKAVRLHWGVENRLHWRLDVVFDDDKCLLHSGFGAVNMSVIKRICMNMLEKDGSKEATKRKIARASLKDDYREQLLFG